MGKRKSCQIPCRAHPACLSVSPPESSGANHCLVQEDGVGMGGTPRPTPSGRALPLRQTLFHLRGPGTPRDHTSSQHGQ